MKRWSWPVLYWVTSALACADEPTAPATRELTLALCDATTWAAYQNEGGPWTRLGPGPGTFTILATDRIALATSDMNFQRPYLRIYYFSADQVADFLVCNNPVAPQTRGLSGSVQGLPAGGFAELSIGSTAGLLTTPDFSLPFAAAGTRDLIAVRIAAPALEHVDRIIMRRAQPHADGVIPLLDFESAEAVAPTESNLTWTGPRAHVQLEYHGADGNRHVLHSQVVGEIGSGDQPRATTIHSVPANLLTAGDMHMLRLFVDARIVVRHFREPGDLAITLGAPANEPMYTTLGTSPTLRVRADIVSQSDYDGSVSLLLTQQTPAQPSGGVVTITATPEHFAGMPATWSLAIPDLTGVEGFENWLGLETGKPFFWVLGVTSRRWGSSASVGDVVRTASRQGTRNN